MRRSWARSRTGRSTGDGSWHRATIVFAILAVATVLIPWFMTRSIRKVPKDLDVPTHSKRPAPLPEDPPAGPKDGDA